MEITTGIFIHDLSLYIKSMNSLIVSDFHIGYEEALNKLGTLIPRAPFQLILDRLEKIFESINKVHGKGTLNEIIIAGDLKHEFGTISEQEWRNTLRLLDFFETKASSIVIAKGNHDTIIGPIAQKRNVRIVEAVERDSVLIAHGDKIPDKQLLKKAKTIIIGHEHPAVSIHDGIRTEVFKCFLKGTWGRKTIIVLPSFNLVNEGADMLKEQPHSPFLQKNLESFSAFIVADTVYLPVVLGSLQGSPNSWR
ncbi:metallophosphoesterase [Candidatus Woesearchaeota archaeon]|nr:metallophosphoesterase [Candidatus Woesearchaeota archaeon]